MDDRNRSEEEDDSDSDVTIIPNPRDVTPQKRKTDPSPEAPLAKRPNKKDVASSSTAPQNQNAVRNLNQLSEFQNYTKVELKEFCKCARKVHNKRRHGMKPFEFIHRAVPDEYLNQYNQAEKMEPRAKDSTGHRCCPANGRFGVFFSSHPYIYEAKVFRKKDTFSPYGRNLLLIRPEKLFTPANYNIYFADYYCFRASTDEEESPHYLTLVVCRKKTETDSFCREHLHKLNMKKNGFFEFDPISETFVQVDSFRLYIEILFCESVSMKLVAKQMSVTHNPYPRGVGKGLGCNLKCKCCNPKFGKSSCAASEQ